MGTSTASPKIVAVTEHRYSRRAIISPVERANERGERAIFSSFRNRNSAAFSSKESWNLLKQRGPVVRLLIVSLVLHHRYIDWLQRRNASKHQDPLFLHPCPPPRAITTASRSPVFHAVSAICEVDGGKVPRTYNEPGQNNSHAPRCQTANSCQRILHRGSLSDFGRHRDHAILMSICYPRCRAGQGRASRPLNNESRLGWR
jgi:hypothetical protein